MKRILLINFGIFNKFLFPPLGLEYIAEILQERNYQVEIVDMAIEKPEGLIKKINKNNYFVIGISIRDIDTTNKFEKGFSLPEIKGLISRIKGITNIPIVLGGAGFSLNPNEILKYLDANFGVRGVGLPALEILLKKIDENEIEKGKVLEFDSGPYLNFTFKRNLLNLKRYQDSGARIGVSTRVGCPFKCIYCTYPKIEGHHLRLRDPQQVINEVGNLVSQKVNQIFFTDSVFNIPSNYSKEICEKIIKRKLSINWIAYLNPAKKHFSRELAKLMKESGLNFAYLGVDSCSDKILRVYKKNFTTSDIENTTKTCKEEGIPVIYNLLFGAPGETKETIDETFEFINRLKPDKVFIHSGVRIYKGTEMEKIAKREKIISRTDNLLWPVFYPFELTNYLIRKSQGHNNYHVFGYDN